MSKPIEMSSKKPVSRFREVVPVKKKIIRDPRFDSLCGTFNEVAFKNAYSFIDDIKKKEVDLLKNEFKKAEDPETIHKLKYLIQRHENKSREEQRKKIKEQKRKEEKQKIMESIKNGEKPCFVKKSDRKMMDLISQYEELKDSGKLKKHINRIRKKNTHKERKNFH